MSTIDLPFLPDDADAARPEDLSRRQRPPRPKPQPMVLGTEAMPKSWPGEDPSAAPFHYIGAAFTPLEFRDYCLQYYFGSAPPSYWVWHHTYNPDISTAPVNPNNSSTWWDRNEQGMTLEEKRKKRKPQLDSIMIYYRDSLGWTVGPHLFVDDLFIWVMTPMYYIGIHCNEGNSYSKNGKKRYSIGCEMIGYYDYYEWSPAIYAMGGWACACVKAALHYNNVYTPAGQDQPWVHDPELSGHRDYTTQKTCPGLKITNEYFTRAAADGWANYQNGIIPGVSVTRVRAKGVPVYQEEDCTGPLWGYLANGEVVELDATYSGNRAHLKDGRGFIRTNNDTVEVVA